MLVFGCCGVGYCCVVCLMGLFVFIVVGLWWFDYLGLFVIYVVVYYLLGVLFSFGYVLLLCLI